MKSLHEVIAALADFTGPCLIAWNRHRKKEPLQVGVFVFTDRLPDMLAQLTLNRTERSALKKAARARGQTYYAEWLREPRWSLLEWREHGRPQILLTIGDHKWWLLGEEVETNTDTLDERSPTAIRVWDAVDGVVRGVDLVYEGNLSIGLYSENGNPLWIDPYDDSPSLLVPLKRLARTLGKALGLPILEATYEKVPRRKQPALREAPMPEATAAPASKPKVAATPPATQPEASPEIQPGLANRWHAHDLVWGRSAIRAAALSADGSTLVLGTHLGVHVIDARTLEPRRLIRSEQPIAHVAVTADGACVAATENRVVNALGVGARSRPYVLSVFDAATGERLDQRESPNRAWIALGAEPDQRYRAADGELVAFDPTGRWRAATRSKTGVTLYDLHRSADEPARVVKGHAKPVSDLAFSHDGMLAVASRPSTFGSYARHRYEATRPPGVVLWAASSGERLADLTLPPCEALAFSPAGRLATVHEEEIRVLDPAGTEERLTVPGTWRPDFLGFVNEDTLVTVCHGDYTVRLLHASDGRELASTSWPQTWVRRLVAHPGGGLSFVVQENRGRVGKQVTERRMVTVDPSGRELNPPADEAPNDTRLDPATSPDGTLRAETVYSTTFVYCMGDRDERSFASGLRLLDAASGALRHELSGRGQLHHFAFASGAPLLAGAHGNRDVVVWSTETGDVVHRTSAPAVPHQVAFDATACRLAYAHGRTSASIVVWDLEAEAILCELSGHTRHVTGLAFSSDGERLASASYDGTVRLWSVPAGPRAVLLGHTGEVHCVAFSADGAHLFSGGYDGSIRRWDVASALAERADEGE
ncbi:MAG: WD40 repeat domain-containing protein [Planctomycetota bacterium]|jgi:WD40 repeat protein